MNEDFKIEINGVDYTVEDFSKTYLQGMVECLSRNRITNVAFLSNSAHVVKKIAVPLIPDTIIAESETDDGLYLWKIEPEDIAEILLKVALAWFERNIPKAKNEGKAAEVALYMSQKDLCLSALGKISNAKSQGSAIHVNEQSKDDQIKLLQAKLLEVEGKK
jgi:hypothetical protein